MIIVVVPFRGPPSVRIQIASKALNVQIADKMPIVTNGFIIRGKVIRRILYSRPAPSAHAASYISLEIDCIDASK